jgi:hypothetical protein
MFELRFQMRGNAYRDDAHSNFFIFPKPFRALIVVLSIALTACGGGGGGGGDGGAPSVTSRNTAPDYSLGTASNAMAAYDKLLLGTQKTQAYKSNYGTSYASLAYAHARLNANRKLPIASVDTHAASQWEQGWTGKGVSIGVLDAFSNNDVLDTHGERVALVANSVAPEADIHNHHFNYSTSAAERAWERMSANGHYIANNSFGRTRYNHLTGAVDTRFDADVNSWVNGGHDATGHATYHPNMLFVFAAGNAGYLCADRRIHACGFRASVTHKLRQAGHADKDAMIWVGALQNNGEAIAGYSLIAGEMKNDFIVAHDNILTNYDAAGTSFAAPRVSGAAALIRQKFPRLSGFGVKSILLATATDMGAPGVDEIYGHGKLDLRNALSPQGDLSTSPTAF